ncbi:hypothetical protein ABIB86_000427 [Bradyrhizobium sp. JR1.7]|uniref:endonuclease VII domain-containing protein n=1 Tax=unclassified Bradyrhizobium TaxID=2631580 RepID=UPI0033953F66
MSTYHREERQKNPERDRKYMLRRFYKMTQADYDEMLLAQGGRCAICRTDKPGPEHYKFLCVDHDHTTGKVRGLLCSPCNVGIGNFSDDPSRLSMAAKYLLKGRN